MTTELNYLTLTALLTALMWVPYVLNRMVTRGILDTMGNPGDDDTPVSSWAQRLERAHYNAAENLVIFATLILTAHAAGVSNSITAIAAAVYFWSRLAHYVIYGFGLPVLRTIAFLISWVCLFAIAMQFIR